VTKDDDGDIDRAEHGEFVCLFEQTTLALQKGAMEKVSTCPKRARDMASKLTLSDYGRP
jgi:hypothetical protein